MEDKENFPHVELRAEYWIIRAKYEEEFVNDEEVANLYGIATDNHAFVS